MELILNPLLYFKQHPWVLVALVAWSLIWKGAALWYAARQQRLSWYIILLVINTLGLLEIFFLLFVRPNYRTGIYRKPEIKGGSNE